MTIQFFIYVYTNQVNGKIYIGQTDNLDRRDREHTFYGHKSMPIDCAIQKYGRSNFDLSTITIIDTEDQANQEEVYWIAEMRRILGRDNVYNLADGGAGSRGREISEETRRKISIANTGKKRTEESKKKQSLATIGRKLSPEHIKNVSEALQGHEVSDETKQKISKSHQGKTLTEETKQKISKGNKGKKVNHSEETRKKISASHIGKIISEEHRQNMSIAQTGRQHSEETKQKMRENSARAKLNYVIAEEIRAQHTTGKYTFKQLAEKFDVGTTTIGRVIRHELWTEDK